MRTEWGTKKLRRVGNSFGVILPRALVDELGLEVGDQISVGRDGGRVILIRSGDVKRRKRFR